MPEGPRRMFSAVLALCGLALCPSAACGSQSDTFGADGNAGSGGLAGAVGVAGAGGGGSGGLGGVGGSGGEELGNGGTGGAGGADATPAICLLGLCAQDQDLGDSCRQTYEACVGRGPYEWACRMDADDTCDVLGQTGPYY